MVITEETFDRLVPGVFGLRVDHTNVTMEDIQAMIAKKEDMEKELGSLFEVLQQENISMDESLVDAELYPRADVDIPKVIDTRVKIIRLKNDLKTVVFIIDKAQELFYQQIPSERRNLNDPVIDVSHIKPIAMVKHVDVGSPSERAGVRSGDLILQFGSITAENCTSLKCINNVILQSKGVYIKVILRRDGKRVRVNLIPKEWAGKGLLGCSIFPAP